MLMLLQTSQWIVTTILEVGEARAGWGGGWGRWPHSVGGRIRTVLESPRLSPQCRLLVALLQESFSLFDSFYDLLPHLPVSATHLSFPIGRWAVLVTSVRVSWLLLWSGSWSREQLSLWGSQSQGLTLMGTLLLFLVTDLWWRQADRPLCYLSTPGYLRWAASWANPGTFFISENSTCYAEVKVSQINGYVLILGE